MEGGVVSIMCGHACRKIAFRPTALNGSIVNVKSPKGAGTSRPPLP